MWAAPENAPPAADVAPASVEVVSIEAEALRAQIQTIANRLTLPGDPPIRLLIGTEFNRRDVTVEVETGRATLFIQPGMFAFTNDLSEFAGVLAQSLSKVRSEYQNALQSLIDLSKIPNGMSVANYLISLEAQARKEQPVDPKRLKTLAQARQIEEQLAKYRRVRAEPAVQDLMKRVGYEADFNRQSEANIKSSIEAIDRLVKGGYSPWGLLSPVQAIAAIENTQPVWRRMLPKSSDAVGQKSINTEVGFLRMYLLYIEKSKVDLSQQPFRGQPLTAEQARARRRAIVTQSALLGPFMQSLLGASVAFGGVAWGLWSVRDWAGELYKSWGSSVQESQSELITKEEAAKVQVPEKPSPQSELALGLGLAALQGIALAGATTVVGYVVDRGPLEIHHRQGGLFFHRYQLFLRNRVRFSRQLSEVSAKPVPTSAELTELIDLHNALLSFVRESISPDTERTLARIIYRSQQRFTMESGYVSGDLVTRTFYEMAREEIARGRSWDDVKESEKRTIGKRASVLMREVLFERGELPAPIKNQMQANGDFPGPGMGAGYQRFLFQQTDAPVMAMAGRATDRLLELVDRHLSAMPAAERENAPIKAELLRLEGFEYLRPETRNAYLALRRKYFPTFAQAAEGSATELGEQKRSGQLSNSEYASLIVERAEREGTSAEAKTRAFHQLVKDGLYTDAARLLGKSLREIAEVVTDPRAPEDLRKSFPQDLEKLLGNWGSVQKGMVSKAWLKTSLFIKALSLSDLHARSAFGSQLTKGARSSPSLVSSQAVNIYQRIIDRHLATEPRLENYMESLIRIADLHGGDSHRVADLLLQRLQREPRALSSPEQLSAIVQTDAFWKAFAVQQDANVADSWERRIEQKYQENAKRNPAFRYNPNHSEKLQTVLIEAFERLHPKATVKESLSFWEALASRGPTGRTDSFFQKHFLNWEASTKKSAFAQSTLESGLIWDTRIRSTLYQESRRESLTGTALREQSTAALDELRRRMREAAQATPADRRAATEAVIAFHRANFDPLVAADVKVTTELKRWAAQNARGRASSGAGVDRFFTEHGERLRQGARIRAINAEVGQLRVAFPETGHTYLELLNWLSGKLETQQAEAKYVADLIRNHKAGNKDLGYSVIDQLVQETLKWNKVERWKLIRWLRGTGPAPEALAKRLERTGPETVRRLFTSLPIFVRQGFLSIIVGAEKSGLLSGIEQRLYYEQILGEILPAGKENAQVAKDFLDAFLNAVAKVSHPEKKLSVMSFLLAQPITESNAGTVLRNALESFGVPGVKLAQAMAASDILPEEIRVELAKTRDRSNEPMRHEIFERFIEVLGIPNVNSQITVGPLLGAASVKYAVKVLDRNGAEHVIQIKRREADVEIGKNFEELEHIIEYLIKRNAEKYAFLRGMVEATKAAIWRELSLQRESERTNQAIAQHKVLNLGEGVVLEIPENSNLIEQIGGKRSRFYYLRSSAFAAGSTLDTFDPETQRALASIALRSNRQLLFPTDDSARTKFDPDRHPGNIIFEPFEKGTRYKPIDWGQLLDLTPELRAQVVRLMSYSQVFDKVGLSEELFTKLTRDFGIAPEKQAALRQKLAKFFPNTAAKPRSSMVSYYYLLAELEVAGFARRIVFYDFIKAIYQLEPYEAVLARAGEATREESPKRILAERVATDAQILTQGLSVSTREAIKQAVLAPAKGKVAKRNAALAKANLLAYDDMLGHAGVSRAGRDRLLKGFDASASTGAEMVEGLQARFAADGAKLSSPDRTAFSRWAGAAESRVQILQGVSAPEAALLLSSGAVQAETRPPETAAKRTPLEQPKHLNPVKATANLYGAELINAVFWSLWDRDPVLARAWFEELMTIGKHLGFAAFAGSAGIYKAIANRAVPMSMKNLRYFNEGGVSMAIGMIGADIARRIYEGQSTDEIMEHVASAANLKDVAFSTALFMASEGMLMKTFDRKLKCPFLFKGLARTSGVFVLAGAMDRIMRKPFTDFGMLERDMAADLREIGQRYQHQIEAQLMDFDARMRRGEGISALRGLGMSDDILASSLGYELKALPANRKVRPDQIGERLFIRLQERESGPAFTTLTEYLRALRELQLKATDTYKIRLIEREIAAAHALEPVITGRYIQSFKHSSEIEIPPTVQKKFLENLEKYREQRGLEEMRGMGMYGGRFRGGGMLVE